MNKDSFLYRAYHLYYDGFRSMTVGKTLWAVSLVKLFIIFFILKLFFFPDVLARKAQGGDKASVVNQELTERVKR